MGYHNTPGSGSLRENDAALKLLHDMDRLFPGRNDTFKLAVLARGLVRAEAHEAATKFWLTCLIAVIVVETLMLLKVCG